MSGKLYNPKKQHKTCKPLPHKDLQGFDFPPGYGKYVYPKETLEEMKSFFHRELDEHFPGAKVEYLV